jgi:hypothetical protein
MARPTKTTTRKPAAKRTTTRRKTVEVAHDDIAVRAYFIHLEGGGDAQSNWLRAEREFLPD